MNSENLNLFYDQIEDYLPDYQRNDVYDLLGIIDFKLSKNKYHLESMKKILKIDIENQDVDMYDVVINPLYFEFESLLVSLRSTVDILLKMPNYLFDLRLENMNLTLANVYKHYNLPKELKNIFDRFTRPYNNPNWNFIYTSRNEIVHSTSIDNVLPIDLEIQESGSPFAFFEFEGIPREIITFLSNSIRFLDNFSNELLVAIRIAYIKNN